MKKLVISAFGLVFFVLAGILILPAKSEKEFETKEFQSRVFNTNILFRIKTESPGYFSGTLINTKNKTYILTCGHGIEELPSLDILEALSLIYDDEGNVVQSRVLNISLLQTSKSEENGGVDLAVFEVLDPEVKLSGAILKNFRLRPLDKVVCVGNSYGRFAYSVYEGSVTKQHMLLNGWPEPYFITTCEVRQGCSGGGVFSKHKGKYYYCGMITRSDLKGVGMFKPLSVIQKWLIEHELDDLLKGV